MIFVLWNVGLVMVSNEDTSDSELQKKVTYRILFHYVYELIE